MDGLSVSALNAKIDKLLDFYRDRLEIDDDCLKKALGILDFKLYLGIIDMLEYREERDALVEAYIASHE